MLLLFYWSILAKYFPCVAAGPDAAAWLAYSRHSARAGAGNKCGQHKPLFSETHLAPGFDWPDGAPPGGTPGSKRHCLLQPRLPDMFLLICSLSLQTLQDSESKKVFHEWQKEREELR